MCNSPNKSKIHPFHTCSAHSRRHGEEHLATVLENGTDSKHQRKKLQGGTLSPNSEKPTVTPHSSNTVLREFQQVGVDGTDILVSNVCKAKLFWAVPALHKWSVSVHTL